MWTAISSYIWGEGDEQIVPGSVDDTQNVDDDWILVDIHDSKIAGMCILLCQNFISSMLLTAKVSEILIYFFSRTRKREILSAFYFGGSLF